MATVNQKRYEEARQRAAARNTGKEPEAWIALCSVDLGNHSKLEFLESPGGSKGNRKFDPAVQLKLSKGRYSTCIRLSAANIADLYVALTESHDEIFDRAESFERLPVAAVMPSNAATNDDLPPPPGAADDLPPPPVPALPKLDKRSQASKRDWLLAAAPQYGELIQGLDSAGVDQYVKTLLASGKFNQKGQRLSWPS